MVIAGGTASGKTTILNALSLFVPSDSKLVSIEDTRELLIPQRNWVAGTTRESFQSDDGSEIDEFEREWRQRELLLAYLIREGIDSYASVAAAIQAYIHSPSVVMRLLATDRLSARLEGLTTMRTIEIDVDEGVESLVPRPTPDETLRGEVEERLDGAASFLAPHLSATERRQAGIEVDATKRQRGDNRRGSAGSGEDSGLSRGNRLDDHGMQSQPTEQSPGNGGEDDTGESSRFVAGAGRTRGDDRRDRTRGE